MYPTSPMGKFVGAVTAVTGVLVLALPITIIGANFASEYSAQQRKTDSDYVGIAIGEVRQSL